LQDHLNVQLLDESHFCTLLQNYVLPASWRGNHAVPLPRHASWDDGTVTLIWFNKFYAYIRAEWKDLSLLTDEKKFDFPIVVTSHPSDDDGGYNQPAGAPVPSNDSKSSVAAVNSTSATRTASDQDSGTAYTVCQLTTRSLLILSNHAAYFLKLVPMFTRLVCAV